MSSWLSKMDGYLKPLKLNCRTLAFTSYKPFLKNKKRPEIILLGSFSA